MTHYDLAIIGTGSGNSIVDERFADRPVAILEKGTFGGTCLNVGCIPTKMFVYPADLARRPRQGARLGVDTPLRRSPLAGDPRPHLRPDRPDLARRPGLPASRLPNVDALRGPRPLRRRPHPRHGHRRDRSPPTRS